MNLNDKALLVQLTISQWTARKYDKRASSEVAANHNAINQAGRYNKALLPMNDYLANVMTKTGLIRQRYLTNTLPWGTEGTRILPSANYLAFMTDFRTLKGEWIALVNDFVSNYGSLKANARTYLGSLYDDADYPDDAAIAAKFAIDMAVFPVPATDFRVALSAAETDAIRSDLEARLNEAQATAMRDVWMRLFDRVQCIVERLSDPNGRFHNSLIENARELCQLLPRLNLTDDPNLEAMRMAVEEKLTGYDPVAIRNDVTLRRTVAEDANEIADAMRMFMGGL